LSIPLEGMEEEDCSVWSTSEGTDMVSYGGRQWTAYSKAERAKAVSGIWDKNESWELRLSLFWHSAFCFIALTIQAYILLRTLKDMWNGTHGHKVVFEISRMTCMLIVLIIILVNKYMYDNNNDRSSYISKERGIIWLYQIGKEA
jgi:hypothetical protein